MSNIVKLKRRVRPLRKTFNPSAPYAVERHDDDDGEIVYEVWDERPDTYRMVARSADDCGGNPYAKFDAEQIARGLNLLVQYGKETMPNVRDRDNEILDDDED